MNVTIRTVVLRTALSVAAALLTALHAGAAPTDNAPAVKPRIEVVFVLDTTGSMGGLIEGAKQKIWSIANEMISARPRPELKIGLIGYRDRGDEYVTRIHDLTDDIDDIYEKLLAFRAEGGGDTPESVNQALHEAVTKIAWSEDSDVLKLIFLVGDCPPHLDYPDDVQYPETCKLAARRDLIINTVQCGNDSSTTPIWEEIARRAEGAYVRIDQSGGMVAMTTPYDADLTRLNAAIGTTLIPWGTAEKRAWVMAKQGYAEAAPAPAAAARLAYNSATAKIVQGGGDLIDALHANETTLAEVASEALPENMRSMSNEERDRYVAQQAARRREIQRSIDELIAKRTAFVEEERRRLIAAGKGDAFDLKVQDILRAQAERKGIRYAFD